MVELPFDVDSPPDEPPPGITQQMLWRVAIRLHHDHKTVVRDASGTVTCELCRQPWPCHGRRLAQRGLVAAWREAVDPAGASGYVDRWLTTDTDGPGA